MDSLFLPNLKILSKKQIFKNEHLLVLGGRTPNLNWLKKASENRVLWAVDRGICAVKKAALTPKFLIGDNDSADKKIWDETVKEGVPFEKYPTEKDFTDLELALAKLPTDAFAILTGAFGGRFDHTFSNAFSAANAKNRVCLADENETLLFLKANDEFEIFFNENPKALSLISITEKCVGVTFKGVHWQLKNATLYQNTPNTISNVLENGHNCKIELSKGILGVYICADEENLRITSK